MYIISGCLLGINCKYNGKNNENDKVIKFSNSHNVYIVCPETSGGLTSPRLPAERVGERVINPEGRDLTQNFIDGAHISLEGAEKRAEELGEKIEGAILKSNSPSCGSGEIYDGTFSGSLVQGSGVFAELLQKKGIKVISEKEI